MNINERMATEVMGWESYWNGYKRDKDDKYFYLRKKSDWHPDIRIDQAMMCAEKSGVVMRIELMASAGYAVRIGHSIFRTGNKYEELPLAICEAILEAMGVK